MQALSDEDTRVYEAVASLAVEGRMAHVADVAHMTDRSEDDVRRSLVALVETGWLVPMGGDGYALGPHDWGLEYH
ncbi:DNA-binding IclR family transcriptional regulator [Thermocatellispora tengchongensis]|uniref:DNA-binding IclR family transcriptional regulator n=1 Tax=Thermocatellispora tengchongensis TaxID=1073253 RepID=A0A840P0F4_9ACTN|nr:hypothetical protein [Thermocatellispora tengchongensis]MBB5132862.1 DNA-binding IclR family transcriptional regulator [Thermocatellispora tengchongensis]